MVHPDHQYDPKIIPELVKPLLAGECDAVFGSRMARSKAATFSAPPSLRSSAVVRSNLLSLITLSGRVRRGHCGPNIREYDATLARASRESFKAVTRARRSVR